MTDAIFSLEIQLGGGQTELSIEEQRIVTEAPASSGRAEDFAPPFAAGNERLGVRCMPAQDQHAGVMRAPVGLAVQGGNKALVVARIRLGFSCEARRMHARRSAQGFDAQTRIVGQGRQSGTARRVARLGEGVFYESVMGLFGLGHGQFSLGNHFQAKRFEQAAKLSQFPRVAAGQDQFAHGRLDDISLTKADTELTLNPRFESKLMNLLRFLLVLPVFLCLSAQAQTGPYYYRLTGLSAGTCSGAAGAVQLAGASITRSAYLPAGDVQTATMVSSTGGFTIGTPNSSFSIGPVGPGATGIFQSGVTTTPGPEPVVVTITINSNVAGGFEARITCPAALAAPQFEVVYDDSLMARIPALGPEGLALLGILLVAAAAWEKRRRFVRR